MTINPAGINCWAQGSRLDLFLAKRNSLKFSKHFFCQGVQIQWPKTLRELIAGRS